MNDDTRIIDMIERASGATPYCACGWHTTPVWRDGVVWLECASLSGPRPGLVRRLIDAATSPAHVHASIVEVPARGRRQVAA